MGRVDDAITRTGTDFQRMLIDREEPRTHPEPPGVAGGVEALFAGAGLGRCQIDQQELGELRKSLAQIEAAIANPLGWSAQTLPHAALELTEEDLREPLAERKRMILRRIDLLVNSSKIRKIQQLVARIPDRRARAAILKELNELLAKDEIIEAEYRRMDADRQTRAGGQAPAGADSPAGVRILAPERSVPRGFATVQAGALLLASAAISLLTVFSTRLSVPEVACAALLVLGGLGLLGRRWAAPRGRRK